MYSKSALRFLSTCGLCVLLTGCGTDIIRVSDKSTIPNPFSGSARFDPATTGSLSSKSGSESDAAGNGDVIAAPSASMDGGGISSAPINAPLGTANSGKSSQQGAIKPLATTVIAPTTDSKQLKKVASLNADQSSSLSVPPNAKPVLASSGNGKWVAQGGTEITLADGETIASLASRYGVPEDAIRGANGLKAKAKLQRGSKLIIPVFVADGAPTNAKAKTDSSKAPAMVAAAPALTTPVNGKAAKKDELAKSAQPAAPETTTQVASLEPAAAASSGASASAADAPKPLASAGFRWPARGRIIQAFGDKNGVKSTGINISLPQGTPVKAAEAGVVAYAGSEVKGFGNLIMVRHPDGWVSVYGNTSEIKVKRGDEIKRGQVIALSGQSGDVSAPQLHFELRKGSVPVDPVEHLSDD